MDNYELGFNFGLQSSVTFNRVPSMCIIDMYTLLLASFRAARRCCCPHRGRPPYVRDLDQRWRLLLGLQLLRTAGDGRHNCQIHPHDGDVARNRWVGWGCMQCVCVCVCARVSSMSLSVTGIPAAFLQASFISYCKLFHRRRRYRSGGIPHLRCAVRRRRRLLG